VGTLGERTTASGEGETGSCQSFNFANNPSLRDDDQCIGAVGAPRRYYRRSRVRILRLLLRRVQSGSHNQLAVTNEPQINHRKAELDRDPEDDVIENHEGG